MTQQFAAAIREKVERAAGPLCPATGKLHNLTKMHRFSLHDEVRFACNESGCGWDYIPARREWTWQGAGPKPKA